MKILFIHHACSMGGSPTSLRYIIEGVKEKRKDIDMKVMTHCDMMEDFYKNLNIETVRIYKNLGYSHNEGTGVYRLAPKDIWINFKIFIQTPIIVYYQYSKIKQENPDIVHLNSTTLIHSAFAAYFAKKPIVWHIREVLSKGNFGIRQKIISKIFEKLSTKVICISEFDRSRILSNSHKITVIYNFIDFEKFDYDKTEPANIMSSKLHKFITMGGIGKIKGLDTILEASIKLNKKHIIYIAANDEESLEGNDIYLQLLKKLVNMTREKGNIVKFIGSRTDMNQVLAEIDTVIFAGNVPHFPRPVFEGWAMKKNIISSDIEGANNHVKHLDNGLLFEVDNSEILSQKMEIVMNEDAIKMKENGYELARNKFDKEKNIIKIIEIYDEIYSKKQGLE